MLKNRQIFLRALEPTDISTIYLWENDARLWSAGSTTAPFSRRQIWEYLENYSADIFAQRQLRLMVCLNDGAVPVGMADLFDFDPRHKRAFIGLLIDPDHQGKGLASQTMELLVEYARDLLGIHQLAAIISTDNYPCVRLFRKLGFQEAGILKDWIATPDGYADQIFFQQLLK